MYFCFRNKSLCGSQYLTPIPRTVAREVCETGYFVAQDTYIKYHKSHTEVPRLIAVYYLYEPNDIWRR